MSPNDPTRSSSTVPSATILVDRLPPEASDPKDTSPAYRACLEIRQIVFIDGQAVPFELEMDGLDQDAVHFLAYGKKRDIKDALGTARMRIVNGVAKAERIAVLAEARGLGIGRALVEEIEAAARQSGIRSIKLNAQTQATEFYEKLGFVARGAVFLEAGIEHLTMTKRLD